MKIKKLEKKTIDELTKIRARAVSVHKRMEDIMNAADHAIHEMAAKKAKKEAKADKKIKVSVPKKSFKVVAGK